MPVCTVEKRKWSQVDQGSSGSSGGPSSRTGSGSSGDEEVNKRIHLQSLPKKYLYRFLGKAGLYFLKGLISCCGNH